MDALQSLSNVSLILAMVLVLLSACNWVLEICRWHGFLKSQSLKQGIWASSFQVLSALPYALIFGKIAGASAGRLLHFSKSNIVSAGKAQFMSALFQSLALFWFLAMSILLVYRQDAMVFALCIIALLLGFVIPSVLARLFWLGVLRTAIIFSSFLVLLANENIINVILTLSKTFSISTFVPFTPLANLGPKEWLMHYFYPEIDLAIYLSVGITVFLFNNLFPAVIGAALLLFKKWR